MRYALPLACLLVLAACDTAGTVQPLHERYLSTPESPNVIMNLHTDEGGDVTGDAQVEVIVLVDGERYQYASEVAGAYDSPELLLSFVTDGPFVGMRFEGEVRSNGGVLSGRFEGGALDGVEAEFRSTGP